jgi:transcriptional antiterminator RfaH
MSLNWFVVHCYPNKESIAAVNLQNQGFNTYIPRYKKLRRHARKVDTVLAPLFPRYFFINLDLQLANWLSINYTPGVNYLLKNSDGLPASIPNYIIDELHNNHDDKGAVNLSILELFKPGDKVRILEGAFVNHVAIYEQMTDTQRVQLLINLIQQPVKISIPIYAVEKV